MIKLTQVIFYVTDVPNTISFYERAFGIKARYVHESGMYAELDTGHTALAFAAESLGQDNLPEGYLHLDLKKAPQACEVVFTVDDVETAFEKAVNAGAVPLVSPKQKPWGQLVAYVRDLNGALIEIASPIN